MPVPLLAPGAGPTRRQSPIRTGRIRVSTSIIASTWAAAAFDELLLAALDLGGTVTGEHGVGLLKRVGMRRELGPQVCAIQAAVKQTLDPLNLFNPGKAT